MLQSPGFLATLALDRALYPKHDPGLRHATPKSVQGLTLKDVHKYYAKVFRPDLTTIVVIGKVDPAQVKTLVRKYFGGWKANGESPATDYPPVPPNKPSNTHVPNKSRVQDSVTLAETLGIKRSNPGYYALALANHVLGGGVFGSRLYQVLRERRGLVYSVGSNVDAGKTRSTFTLNYASDPDKVDQARRLAVRSLVRMQKHPIDATELRRAKAFALRQIPLNEASTGSIAQGLLHDAAEGLPLDEPTRAAHRYMKLDARDLRQAFAKWLRPKDLVQIVEGPKPASQH
jgi:zinc protease